MNCVLAKLQPVRIDFRLNKNHNNPAQANTDPKNKRQLTTKIAYLIIPLYIHTNQKYKKWMMIYNICNLHRKIMI